MTADLLINVIVMITLIVGLTATFVELAGVSRNVGLLTRATLASGQKGNAVLYQADGGNTAGS
jgi:hypothetical protein